MENQTHSVTPEIIPQQEISLVKSKQLPLWQIMELIDQMEKGVEMTPEEMKDVGTALRSKVDGCKQFIDFCQSTSEMITFHLTELAEAKRVVEAKIERLKQYIRDCMVEYQFDKLPGNIYQARLQNNSQPKVTVEQAFERPDSDLYRKFPDFIRRTYAWDLSAVGKAIEAGDKDLAQYAKVERGRHVRFGVKKE